MIDYDVIRLICELNNTDYGVNTCFDYIDSLIEKDGKKAVVCFIEPCGDIVSPLFDTYEECLQWWIDVFNSQPEGWSYIQAGWHLFEKKRLPKNHKKVWK